MSSDFVETKVREIVAEQLGLGVDDVLPEATLAGDLGADVLDIVELMMAFEEEFEVEIDDEEAQRLKTVKDVVSFVSRRT